MLYVLCCVAFVTCFSSACEEPWVLYPKNKDIGNTVVFKNETTKGKSQSLTWAWSSGDSEYWKTEVTHSFVDGSINGSLEYRNRQYGEKIHAHIIWKQNGNDISWTSNHKKILNGYWRIVTWDGITLEFHSDKYGQWEFIILDKYKINHRNNHMVTDNGENTISVPRRKRSEGEIEESPRVNPEDIDVEQAGVLECLYDFFFGEADGITGRSEGVFVKVTNWFKGVACRISGDCEEGGRVPSIIPPVTMPPYNPDAEPAPEIPPSSTDNDLI